ncbi:MAG: BrnT family toxin [Phycisphaerae bacterium]|nr:BrnT family toxin [Phycisphaerae bacterium]
MALEFEWDTRKAAANRRKHKVSFVEAATAFADRLSLTIADPDHSDLEDRFVLLGLSCRGRLLVVVHTEQDDTIRIISARKASRREEVQYGRQ